MKATPSFQMLRVWKRLIVLITTGWLLSLSAISALQADPLTWDASGANPYSPTGASGNWDTNPGNATWSNLQTAPAGTAQDFAWDNNAGNVAVFSNSTDLGNLTIDGGNVSANGLVFNNNTGTSTPGYTIDDNGIGANTLTLTGAAPTITTNSNANIQAVIAGSSGFIKDGTGVLTLSTEAGDNNTYTGNVTVAAGELNLSGANYTTLITGDLTINPGANVQTSGANHLATTSNVTVNGTLGIGNSETGSEFIGGLSGSGQVQFNSPSNPALTLNLTRSQTFNGTLNGQGNIVLNAAHNNLTQTLSNGLGNSFNGNITLNSGTLSVNSLQNGQPLNLTFNGGTFQYTGLGATTYAQISLGQNGGTIDASGSGALVLFGNTIQNNPPLGPPASATRTLTLTGSSTAENILSMRIPDPINLVKNGSGMWVLDGPGQGLVGVHGAQINQGTLELIHDAQLGGGNVTLNGGSTLEITGENISFANYQSSFNAAGGKLYLNNGSASIGQLSRPSGGGLVIIPTDTNALGTTEKVTVSAGLPVVNGIVDASLVATKFALSSSADFLTYDTTKGLIYAFAAYSSAPSITNGYGGTSATSVFHATSYTNNFISAPTKLYALKIDQNVTVGGNTLTLGDGLHTAGLIIDGGFASNPTRVETSITFATGSEGSVYVGGDEFDPLNPQTSAFINGTVSGTNGFTKNGDGNLEIATANYSGATTVNDGALKIDFYNPINYRYDGLTKNGNGFLELVNNYYSPNASTTINGGTVQFDNGPLPSYSSAIYLAGTLLYNNNQFSRANLILNGDSTIGARGEIDIHIANGYGHSLTISNMSSTGLIYLGGRYVGVSQYIVTEGSFQFFGDISDSQQIIVGSKDGTATFGGRGYASNLVLNAGGKLTPGLFHDSSPLYAKSLVWSSDNTPQVELQLVNPGGPAQLNLGTGAFTKGTGDTFIFDFLGTGQAGETYDLVDFGLNNTNFEITDFQAADLAQGLTGNFFFTKDGTKESLEFAVAPEPGISSLLVSSLISLVLFARFRNLKSRLPTP